METATAAETTRRIVIERDIPEPAVAGLVEFIDRYYIKSKARFIEPLSFRKTVSGTGFKLFWTLKPVGPEQATPLPVSLQISQPAVALNSSPWSSQTRLFTELAVSALTLKDRL